MSARTHFYVVLNKTGQRMKAWGQFDPATPEASLFPEREGEMKFDPEQHASTLPDDADGEAKKSHARQLARWAVTQPLDKTMEVNGKKFQFTFRELKSGEYFWCGEPAQIAHLGHSHAANTPGAAAAWCQKEMEKVG